ncbi:unnamed protein product [Blepharisma stoltei]|uniref:Uncharacterized protein n=1 Tax=Blepharisma stoltei TaxID=1481888 RepID=A0AAU9JVF3_9CILI|nr:unnamed protein product [Blepharisma stoltei]
MLLEKKLLMENDQILNINPAFKHLLDKCNINPSHLRSNSFDIPQPIRNQQRINLHFVSKSINSIPKTKMSKNECTIKFKPEDLTSIKIAIKDTFNTNKTCKLENSDENYNATESIPTENTQEEKPKIEEKSILKLKENAVDDMKNTISYKELINYKTGDLKKRKKTVHIAQDPFSYPNLKHEQNSIVFARPFTTTAKNPYKMSFTEYCYWDNSHNNTISRSKPKKKTIGKPKKICRNITTPPVHKIFDSLGLVKLSEKLKIGKTNRSSSEIRPRQVARNADDANKSYNHIIETCEKEHFIYKSFVKGFKQEGESIVNKFRRLNQENSSEKMKLKIWEKEEIVKYKKNLNEMTKTQMLAFKSINERRISKCSNSDKLLLHL